MYEVYIEIDKDKNIIKVESSAFYQLKDLNNAIKIDEGEDGEIYGHAQPNYLLKKYRKPTFDALGNPNFKYENGSVIENLNNEKGNIESIKEEKKTELSFKCKETISKGVDVVFKNETEHFSLTLEDQLNLMRKKDQLEKGETKIEYHADGKSFRFYSKEDMQKIIDSADEFISYQTSYCNSLFQWIKSLNSVDEVQIIQYGDLVPLSFQSEPLKEMII